MTVVFKDLSLCVYYRLLDNLPKTDGCRELFYLKNAFYDILFVKFKMKLYNKYFDKQTFLFRFILLNSIRSTSTRNASKNFDKI